MNLIFLGESCSYFEAQGNSQHLAFRLHFAPATHKIHWESMYLSDVPTKEIASVALKFF